MLRCLRQATGVVMGVIDDHAYAVAYMAHEAPQTEEKYAAGEGDAAGADR